MINIIILVMLLIIIIYLMKSLNIFKFLFMLFNKGKDIFIINKIKIETFVTDDNKKKYWNTFEKKIIGKKSKFDEIN